MFWSVKSILIHAHFSKLCTFHFTIFFTGTSKPIMIKIQERIILYFPLLYYIFPLSRTRSIFQLVLAQIQTYLTQIKSLISMCLISSYVKQANLDSNRKDKYCYEIQNALNYVQTEAYTHISNSYQSMSSSDIISDIVSLWHQIDICTYNKL